MKHVIAAAVASTALIAAGSALAANAQNDDFTEAELISGSSVTTDGLTPAATREAGEPSHGAPAGYDQTVWYRWTAPASGSVTVSTCTDITLTTYAAAYTGGAVNALTKVPSTDSRCSSVMRGRRLVAAEGARIVFDAVAGTEYRIAVAANADGGFNLALALTAAPPDTVAPETVISKGPKKKVKKKKGTFVFSSPEAGATFECALNKAPFAACTSPAKVKAKKGRNKFQVRAVDAAGNPDATPAVYSWKVEKKKKRK
jgi:hypothetical protein